jgi:hypothetical protein
MNEGAEDFKFNARPLVYLALLAAAGPYACSMAHSTAQRFGFETCLSDPAPIKAASTSNHRRSNLWIASGGVIRSRRGECAEPIRQGLR